MHRIIDLVQSQKMALNFNNIILKHNKCVVNSRSECGITTTLGGKVIACPVIPTNMKSIINEDICKLFDDNKWGYVFQRVDEEKIFPFVGRANNENWHLVSISVGIKPFYIDLLKKIHSWDYRLDVVEIDLALGFTERILPIVELVKNLFPKATIIAGNGDSPEFIQFLEKNGVDIAKINVGVSSACRTRQYVGFGSTTITDLVRCYEAADTIKILEDGGITVENGEVHIGDIAKAIRFGASYIQSGALFSRCIDSPSLKTGYYGNASLTAKQHSNNIEGTTLAVQTNGLTIKEMMKLITDSLKSSVSYAGGKDLLALRKVDYQILI